MQTDGQSDNRLSEKLRSSGESKLDIQVNITFCFSYTGPKIDRGSNWLSLFVSSKEIARLSLRQLGIQHTLITEKDGDI